MFSNNSEQHLQSQKGSNGTNQGTGRADSIAGSGIGLGSSSTSASLGASSRARVSLGAGRRGTGAGSSGIGASSRARAGTGARARASGSLGSSFAGDVEVLANAALNTIGELLSLLGAAVTLRASGGTLGGVIDILVVGRRNSDAMSLAVDISGGTLVEACLSGGLSSTGRSSGGLSDSNDSESAGNEEGSETHLDDGN